MRPVVNFPLTFGLVPRKGTRAAPSVLLLRGDTLKKFIAVAFSLPAELLFGKLRLGFMKAERGSSVEVSSSAGSVVPANVSVPTL